MVNSVLHSHKLLVIFHQVCLEIVYENYPLDLSLLSLFVLHLLPPCNNKYYTARNYPFIQITTNWMNNSWINHIDKYFLGTYIHKVKYCLIIYLESFKIANV